MARKPNAGGVATQPAPAAPPIPAWQRLAAAGMGGQGSAAANRAAAAGLPSQPAGPPPPAAVPVPNTRHPISIAQPPRESVQGGAGAPGVPGAPGMPGGGMPSLDGSPGGGLPVKPVQLPPGMSTDAAGFMPGGTAAADYPDVRAALQDATGRLGGPQVAGAMGARLAALRQLLQPSTDVGSAAVGSGNDMPVGGDTTNQQQQMRQIIGAPWPGGGGMPTMSGAPSVLQAGGPPSYGMPKGGKPDLINSRSGGIYAGGGNQLAQRQQRLAQRQRQLANRMVGAYGGGGLSGMPISLPPAGGQGG